VDQASLALVRRAIAQYNLEFAAGGSGISEETRALWVDEPVIVPFRAAVEGTRYSGATALDEFVSDVRDTWTWLRIEDANVQTLDERRAVVSGTVHGVSKGFGAETEAEIALLFELSGDRIAAARVFLTEQAALEAAAE
jgi:hypothetical protein